ncbi:MAG: DUF2442 domain-containing protein [Burkholderiales bacterium]|nr:DUF2442 domain-containing protein [Burkholderiales bacterium]
MPASAPDTCTAPTCASPRACGCTASPASRWRSSSTTIPGRCSPASPSTRSSTRCATARWCASGAGRCGARSPPRTIAGHDERPAANSPAGVAPSLQPRVPRQAATVKSLPGLRSQVSFGDGTEGEAHGVDLVQSRDAGVFAALADPAVVAQAFVEHGAVSWPGEPDLAPDAMYECMRRSRRRGCGCRDGVRPCGVGWCSPSFPSRRPPPRPGELLRAEPAAPSPHGDRRMRVAGVGDRACGGVTRGYAPDDLGPEPLRAAARLATTRSMISSTPKRTLAGMRSGG